MRGLSRVRSRDEHGAGRSAMLLESLAIGSAMNSVTLESNDSETTK